MRIIDKKKVHSMLEKAGFQLQPGGAFYFWGDRRQRFATIQIGESPHLAAIMLKGGDPPDDWQRDYRALALTGVREWTDLIKAIKTGDPGDLMAVELYDPWATAA